MRRLRPGFSAIVVTLVALTVGAGVILTTVASRVLFAASTPTEPERLFRIYTADDTRRAVSTGRFGASSLLDFRDAEAALGKRAILAAYFTTTLAARRGDQDLSLEAHLVTERYFDVLRVQPMLGSLEAFGTGAVAISHDLWVDGFGRSAEVLGTPLVIGGAAFTIHAVLPAGFRGADFSRPANLWLPYASRVLLQPDVATSDASYRDERTAGIVGRLLTGASLPDFAPPLSALSSELERVYPETNARRFLWAVPFPFLLGPAERAELGIEQAYQRGTLLVVAILVLAYANTVNLFAVRSLLARREIAIRKALGATDRRLVLDALTPIVALVIPGVLVGWLAGHFVLGYWISQNPLLARTGSGPDSWTVVALLTTSLLATTALGCVPALWAQAQAPAAALSSAENDIPRRHARLLWGLVALQVAIACGAGGIVYSGTRRVRELERIQLGFDVDRVIDTRVRLRTGDAMGPETHHRVTQFLERIAKLSGVESVDIAQTGLLINRPMRQAIGIVGRTFAPDESPSVRFDVVGPNYFRTVGLRALSGGFSPEDFRQADFMSVVVNQAFAEAYLPAGRETEQTVLLRERFPVRVTGIVANAATDGLRSGAEPRMFLPTLVRVQRGEFQVIIRTRGDATAAADAIDRAIADDPDLERKLVARSAASRRARIIEPVRTSAQMMTALLALMVALVAIGTYGVLSVSLLSRKRSIVIRLALGADPTRLALFSVRPAIVACLIGGTAATIFSLVSGMAETTSDVSVLGVFGALALVLTTVGLTLVPLVRRVIGESPAEVMRN